MTVYCPCSVRYCCGSVYDGVLSLLGQVLLWFSRSDSRSKVLCRACTRLQLHFEAVYSQERAIEAFSVVSPQLVIIDQRNSKPVTGAPAL